MGRAAGRSQPRLGSPQVRAVQVPTAVVRLAKAAEVGDLDQDSLCISTGQAELRATITAAEEVIEAMTAATSTRIKTAAALVADRADSRASSPAHQASVVEVGDLTLEIPRLMAAGKAHDMAPTVVGSTQSLSPLSARSSSDGMPPRDLGRKVRKPMAIWIAAADSPGATLVRTRPSAVTTRLLSRRR